VHQLGHLFTRLHTVDGFLHLRVEILHPEAQAIEAQAMQALEPTRVDGPGVDFDRLFGPGHETEGAAQGRQQLREFVVAQEGGRAATEVQLRHRLRRAQLSRDESDLLSQVGQVGRRAVVVARDHLVARAVVADRLAEGDVHVNGERAGPAGQCTDALRTLSQGLCILIRPVSLDETIRGGIRCVARPLNIQAGQGLARNHRGFWGGVQGLFIHPSECAKVAASRVDLDQGRGHESSNNRCIV
jgi:hypothetical protein